MTKISVGSMPIQIPKTRNKGLNLLNATSYDQLRDRPKSAIKSKNKAFKNPTYGDSLNAALKIYPAKGLNSHRNLK